MQRILIHRPNAIPLRLTRFFSNGFDTLKYEKKTPLEHILLRPGMYIGQTEWIRSDSWIYNQSEKAMEKRNIMLSPALLKIFDEILVNAADNFSRDRSMDEIRVNFTHTKDGVSISVRNNGKSIPPIIHEKEKIYVPELIFGHLLTGSNFNDDSNRITGGSFGYGSKLTNIFSKKFEVELFDKDSSISYKQIWQNNMTSCSKPEIKKMTNQTDNSTKITFEPDLDKFGFTNIPDQKHKDALIQDLHDIIYRRTMDIAGSLGNDVHVYFNSHELNISSFQDYVDLYNKSFSVPIESENLEGENGSASVEGENVTNHIIKPLYHENKNWKVGLTLSPSREFESISFVNNVFTPQGGTHVQYILSQISKHIETILKKKNISSSPTLIRNNLMLFVSCNVSNPTFDGQTKDALLTKSTNFSEDGVLPNTFLKELTLESPIVKAIIDDIKIQEKLSFLSSVKTSSKKKIVEISKLDDAHFAGGKQGLDCTLILTEGDSAKALAVAGISQIGREFYGVMPLRGKFLNVRMANKRQVVANEELMNLIRAVGLDFKKKYNPSDLSGSGLRYGKIMLMCDQDHDGSHIKGLIINFFHYFWPELLDSPGFLQEFVTPIIKVRQRGKSVTSPLSFYSMYEYQLWKEQQNEKLLNNSQVKYYKGLGTSTADEGREYFQAIDKHSKLFMRNPISTKLPVTKSLDDDLIDLAFSKTRVLDRKDWLLNTYSPSNQLDISQQKNLTYSDFINKELIHFSFSDNLRSIPSVIDGLKPSQRKVLFGCFKKNLTDECKVVQLAGYIAEHTAYHHGEASLHSTIINMAQDFVGSNNIPLLEPIGQFGTRADGGKDFASARYIYTKLSPLARLIFPKEDDPLLEYAEEDGFMVEPKYFVPIIPFLLINGSNGIGTGWSTTVPNFNILDIINMIEKRLKKGTQANEPLMPYYHNFTGNITMKAPNEFASDGIYTRKNTTTLVVSELPVGIWTEDYKKYLYKLIEGGKIKGFKEYHTSKHITFHISMTGASLTELMEKPEKLEKLLKLKASIALSNMHAFNVEYTKIQKFESPEEIIDIFFPIRLQLYQRRKEILLQTYSQEEQLCRMKSQFVQDIVQGKIRLFKASSSNPNHSEPVPEKELTQILKSLGFKTFEEITKNKSQEKASQGYNYLLEMSFQSLTQEKSKMLHKKAEEASKSLQEISDLKPEDLWLSDLKKLQDKYKQWIKAGKNNFDDDKNSEDDNN